MLVYAESELVNNHRNQCLVRWGKYNLNWDKFAYARDN